MGNILEDTPGRGELWQLAKLQAAASEAIARIPPDLKESDYSTALHVVRDTAAAAIHKGVRELRHSPSYTPALLTRFAAGLVGGFIVFLLFQVL